MLKGGKYSLKALPFQPVAKNKFNDKRSTFNFKALPSKGLVYNPPAAIISPAIKTPKAFLPKNDPRLKLEGKFKTYTSEELEDYPIIYGYSKEKSYNITPQMVKQIVELRNQNPAEWTISKLAKKFGIDQMKVNVITGLNKQRVEQIGEELDAFKKTWPTSKLNSREDRKKRVSMWLRNEY